MDVAIASALHKRPGAQLLVISTAGQGTESPLSQLRARGLARCRPCAGAAS